jgi:aryl carrier-like protein
LVVGTAFLVVWTVYLGWELPRVYVAAHWKLAWVGLDSAQVIVLLLTTWAAFRRRLVVILFANAAATMFIIDAWFDVTTARSRSLHDSIISAVGVELPAAFVLIWVSWTVLRRAVGAWAAHHEGDHSIWHVQIPRRNY